MFSSMKGESMRKIRILVDMTGGVIHSVTTNSDLEVEVLFIDEAPEPEEVRAALDYKDVWAGQHLAESDPTSVDQSFENIRWEDGHAPVRREDEDTPE